MALEVLFIIPVVSFTILSTEFSPSTKLPYLSTFGVSANDKLAIVISDSAIVVVLNFDMSHLHLYFCKMF